MGGKKPSVNADRVRSKGLSGWNRHSFLAPEAAQLILCFPVPWELTTLGLSFNNTLGYISFVILDEIRVAVL